MQRAVASIGARNRLRPSASGVISLVLCIAINWSAAVCVCVCVVQVFTRVFQMSFRMSFGRALRVQPSSRLYSIAVHAAQDHLNANPLPSIYEVPRSLSPSALFHRKAV